MRTRLLFLVSLVVFGFIVSGCSSNQAETASMEQIYAEQGVPVTVEVLKPGEYKSEVEYNAVLTGIQESSAFATISDKIDKIIYAVGDYIEKDAVVLSLPTDNPSANYFQSKLAFENAKATFERMSSYYETGGLSKQDFDNARTSYKVAEANWEAVRQSVLIKAPISGILTRLNVRESENVHKDDELFTISRVDRLKARIWVSDKEIVSINKGQKATAVWNGIKLNGKVTQVDLSMNQNTKAFGIVVEFDNPDNKVKCGVTASVSIETYGSENAVIIERKDLFGDENDWYVFVDENGTARKRSVQIGMSSGGDIEIIDGLTFDDSLITEGQFHLKDGTKIKVVNGNVSETTSN